jgi:uncharacterized protein YndB with AHSA1/START domain
MAAAVLLVCEPLVAQTTGPLVHERLIEAPVEKVWDAWTTTDGLKAWLAPHAAIDFRIGGAMRTNYSSIGTLDDPGSIENTILAYDPLRMLSMRVSKAPVDFPFPNAIYAMWTVLYFDAVSPTHTRVRVVANGFGSDDESQRMRAFFNRGNASTLEQLASGIGPRDE